MTKLNIGCGTSHRSGMWNIDLVSVRGVDEVADGTNLLSKHPEWVGKIEIIHCYHVFEHFAYDDAVRAIGQWYQLLGDGGTLIMELPDIAKLCKMVADGDQDTLTMAYIFGCQDRDGQYHKWGWSPASIKNLLEKTGFSKIEFPDPVDYHSKEKPCFRVEAEK